MKQTLSTVTLAVLLAAMLLAGCSPGEATKSQPAARGKKVEEALEIKGIRDNGEVLFSRQINGEQLASANSGVQGEQKGGEAKFPPGASFFEQLTKYVEHTRPIIPASGEVSMGSVPSKAREKYALPAVIALNYYLAEQQYETWSTWPGHPEEPVLVRYEILDPERGGMYTPWIYSLGARLYWAVFKQNPMVASKLTHEQNGMVNYEKYPEPTPAQTWYENVIFRVAPDPAHKPSAEEPVAREGETWSRQEYGGKGWTVERSEYDSLPPGVEKQVETKGLPMLFDIPFPSEYRGE